jgi:ribonuclease D
MLADLERAREIAVDTEADSFFNYREQVCLIQITADERDWLVDPLAGLDLTPLGAVFADPARLKVFHDGEYDVLMLKRSFRFRFANLFDTRIAASALGDPAPGLAAVLKAHFGLELDKSMQRSDWSQRPLRPEQLAYARMDTHYLVRLMSLQVQALRERERLFIVEGECRRLEQLEPASSSFDPNEFARIKGARNLDALGKRSLRELFVERERLAEEANLPPFKVLHNDVLLDIAAHRPTNPEQLGRLRGITPRQLRRVGPSVLAALERARSAGPLERLPQLPRRDGTDGLTEAEFELHERLKEWRTERAKREGFDAALVLNRHVLVRLAQHKPRHLEELERIEGLQPWQAQRYGPELCAFVARTLEEFAREGLPGRPRRR